LCTGSRKKIKWGLVRVGENVQGKYRFWGDDLQFAIKLSMKSEEVLKNGANLSRIVYLTKMQKET